MIQHQLSIQARFRPEMLERVLRVVAAPWLSGLCYEYVTND